MQMVIRDADGGYRTLQSKTPGYGTTVDFIEVDLVPRSSACPRSKQTRKSGNWTRWPYERSSQPIPILPPLLYLAFLSCKCTGTFGMV